MYIKKLPDLLHDRNTHGVLWKFISSMALTTRDTLHVRIYTERVKIGGV